MDIDNYKPRLIHEPHPAGRNWDWLMSVGVALVVVTLLVGLPFFYMYVRGDWDYAWAEITVLIIRLALVMLMVVWVFFLIGTIVFMIKGDAISAIKAAVRTLIWVVVALVAAAVFWALTFVGPYNPIGNW